MSLPELGTALQTAYLVLLHDPTHTEYKKKKAELKVKFNNFSPDKQAYIVYQIRSELPAQTSIICSFYQAKVKDLPTLSKPAQIHAELFFNEYVTLCAINSTRLTQTVYKDYLEKKQSFTSAARAIIATQDQLLIESTLQKIEEAKPERLLNKLV